jgi:DNA-binding SARP family transcriptional activator
MSRNAHQALAPSVPRAAAVTFRALGPLEVHVDGEVTILRRQKESTLLALLLLRVGEVASTDWLIDELWAGEPPETARASVHNAICRLRKVLGADALRTRADGYALDVPVQHTDVGWFRGVVADARAAATTGYRARRLREALALWRGPALADVWPTPSIELEASLLNESRISTLEDAIEAELELGRDADLVPELERLISKEPFRERPRAQLMLALYRSGRQLSALEAFKDARKTLSGVGLEPSPPLRELERAILNHHPTLALRRPSLRTSRARRDSARSVAWPSPTTAASA